MIFLITASLRVINYRDHLDTKKKQNRKQALSSILQRGNNIDIVIEGESEL